MDKSLFLVKKKTMFCERKLTLSSAHSDKFFKVSEYKAIARSMLLTATESGYIFAMAPINS